MDRHTHAFQVRPPSLVSQQGFAFLLFSYLITFFLLSLTTTLLVRSSMDLRAAERSVAMNHVFWVEESAADLAYRTLQTSEPPVLVVGACQQNFATVTLQGTTATANLCLEAEEEVASAIRQSYRVETDSGGAPATSHTVKTYVELLIPTVQFPAAISVGGGPILLSNTEVEGPIASYSADVSKPFISLLEVPPYPAASLEGDVLVPGGGSKETVSVCPNCEWEGEVRDVEPWEPPVIQAPPWAIPLEDLVSPVDVVLPQGEYVVDHLNLVDESDELLAANGTRLYVRETLVVQAGTIDTFAQRGLDASEPFLIAYVGESNGVGVRGGEVEAVIYAPTAGELGAGQGSDDALELDGALVMSGFSSYLPDLNLPAVMPVEITYDESLAGRRFRLGASSLSTKAWLMSLPAAVGAPAPEGGDDNP